MTDTTTANQDTLLGKLVVEYGLATPQEVEAASRHAAREANEKSLGAALVAQQIITASQLDRLRDRLAAERVTQQIPGFQILSKLGAGAMATVFKARQLSLDRLVAIKVLPKKHTANPQFVQRFYAEGRAAAKLNHPNIVGAYDVGKAGEYHFFVMEYVEGKTVFDDLMERGKYDEAEAIRIVIQVAEALDHAHRAGFIHRDVKPKNIMIMPDGTAKLADMGLARAVSDREAAEAEKGKAHGTPYYISPEQIRGIVDIDQRCDLYGLGATFYHMVTGRVPFDGPNPSAVMHQHLKQEPTPPDHLNPRLTAGLSEIIEVCMAKDRDRRYQSAAYLIEDLRAVQRGEPPVHARRAVDFSSLSALEQKAPTVVAESPQALAPPALWAQPLFWVAAFGWLMAIILLMVLIVSSLGR